MDITRGKEVAGGGEGFGGFFIVAFRVAATDFRGP